MLQVVYNDVNQGQGIEGTRAIVMAKTQRIHLSESDFGIYQWTILYMVVSMAGISLVEIDIGTATSRNTY